MLVFLFVLSPSPTCLFLLNNGVFRVISILFQNLVIDFATLKHHDTTQRRWVRLEFGCYHVGKNAKDIKADNDTHVAIGIVPRIAIFVVQIRECVNMIFTRLTALDRADLVFNRGVRVRGDHLGTRYVLITKFIGQ